MIIEYANKTGRYKRETTVQPIKTCKTCKYKKNNKTKCTNCTSFSSYEINTSTMKRMGGYDRVMKGYCSSQAIYLTMSMFGVSYEEAKRYYWNWRKSYVTNREW